jgi:endogenous inhibitor of DNA gyrase (YacG/DUF329 family)
VRLKPAMKCPICKKEVAFEDPYMPFCGERCKIIDLGHWAAEKYVISTPMEPEAERGGTVGPPHCAPGAGAEGEQEQDSEE